MSDLDIREQIAHYVAREIDAAALEDWLHDYAWKLEDSGGPLALRRCGSLPSAATETGPMMNCGTAWPR